MRVGRLVRSLLRVLAMLSALTAVAVLDWYPTLKDLGRLRRERGDLERTIRDYRAAAAAFRFPDAGEEALLAASEAELRRALPAAENDGAWAALALVDIEGFVRRDRIPHARSIPIAPVIPPGSRDERPGPAAPAGTDPLGSWIRARAAGIAAGFAMAEDPGRFPWHGVFAGLEPRGGRPASRAVGLAAAAPLPGLLDFVNHVSWGETRLEIVRLYLEPGIPLSRAWMVCRGVYRASRPSARPVAPSGGEGEALLVDRDSPWLLRPVDPLFAPVTGMRELPPAGSPW